MTDIMAAAALVILTAASIYDIRTLEVPLWLTCGGIGIELSLLVELMITGDLPVKFFIMRLGFSIFLFVTFYIGMKYGNFGGADTLLITMVYLAIGYDGIYAVMLSFVYVIPYTLYMKIKKCEHSYAFVPYLFAGYITVIIFSKLL